jgi:amino acid transporter
VIALTSIGTLFAFVLVCGGILVLQQRPDRPPSKFRVPAISGKYIIPLLFIFAISATIIFVPEHFSSLLQEEGLPMLVFWLVAIIITILSYTKDFSLIPVLGLLSCFYLMAQESHTNWYRFLIWLAIGLVIYFLYSRRNSRLAQKPGSRLS